jgi:hypothetical protein
MATVPARASFFDRVAVVHDIDGPRVRLAVLWSAAVAVALLLGTTGLALVFGVTGAIGALQVAARWRQAGEPANQPLAAAGAALIVVAATVGNVWCGLAVLAFTMAALLFPEGFDQVPLLAAGDDPHDADAAGATLGSRLRRGLDHAANTLGPGLAMGLAGAAAIQTARVENMAFLFLFVAISTYDAGDFLCGAGYATRVAGPVAGMLGVAVVTMAMYVAEPPPFRGTDTLWAGAIVAVGCPLGQWLASWLLPTARAKAPGLRRLDAWIVSAPAFLVILWLIDRRPVTLR